MSLIWGFHNSINRIEENEKFSIFGDFTECYVHIPAPAVRYFDKQDLPLFFKEISAYKIGPSVAKKGFRQLQNTALEIVTFWYILPQK